MAMGGRCMDALRAFLLDLKRRGLDQGHWLGLVNLLIGRRIETAEGQLVSAGLTWRELAALLKTARWNKNAVREVELDPKELPPRNRQQYWFTAIARAQVDSPQAKAAGDRLAEELRAAGYVIT